MNRASALQFLASEQRSDGSFLAPLTESLERLPERPTVFQTLVIADCLHSLNSAKTIVEQAADYVGQQCNDDGSLNYWQRGHAVQQVKPYPNDLDDTAYAMAFLHRVDSTRVSSEQWGKFAHLLVSAEQATGGPYATWLVDPEKLPDWHQVEVPVNANIGYALAQQQVTPSGLRRYIETAIINSDYGSDFYVGEVPGVYFISRWYQGDQQPVLATKITSLLDHAEVLSDMHVAMLLSAAHAQRVAVSKLHQLVDRLSAHQQANGSWLGEALFIDYYGGSAAITTALVLEAVCSSPEVPVSVVQPRRLSLHQYPTADIPDSVVRKQYVQTVRRVLQSPAGEQISSAADLAMAGGNWRISERSRRALNVASLHGWIAYTLYDDVLDQTAPPARICVANIALRRSFDAFLRASQSNDYRRYVQRVFTTMDCANAWELRHARATVVPGGIRLTRLPEFGDCNQLAERSLGHSLAAIGVAFSHYSSLSHPDVVQLQLFFKHFLIARQLNDDAHDWEDDLRAGQLSVAVSALLTDYGKRRGVVATDSELPELQAVFWNQTVNRLSQLIARHCQLARAALAAMPSVLDNAVFYDWLNVLDLAAGQAIAGRDEALAFMHAYEADNG